MIKYLSLVAAAAMLCSCASGPQALPHFVAPSTAPIAQRQTAIAQKQTETAQHLKNAQTIVKTIHLSLPADQLKIDALSRELDSAVVSNDQLKIENDGLKTDNSNLTKQIGVQTGKANKAVDDYNHLKVEDDKKNVIIKQVNAYWGIGAIKYGFVRLLKHLFILGAVLAGLALVIFVLSFFFPFIIPIVKSIGNVIAMPFRALNSYFHR